MSLRASVSQGKLKHQVQLTSPNNNTLDKNLFASTDDSVAATRRNPHPVPNVEGSSPDDEKCRPCCLARDPSSEQPTGPNKPCRMLGAAKGSSEVLSEHRYKHHRHSVATRSKVDIKRSHGFNETSRPTLSRRTTCFQPGRRMLRGKHGVETLRTRWSPRRALPP